MVRTRRFVRVRAILAGGLVLGVGGSLTLAAWTDSEFGQATFTASIFDTQSSVNLGTAWVDANVSPGSTFTFPVTGMSPTTVRYAPFWIRTKAGSLDGTLALQAATTTNATFAAALKYRVVRYSSGTCDATQFTPTATYIVGATGTPAAGGSAITAPVTATTSVAANQTANTQFCFEVSMNADAPTALQGQSITAIWEVKATSSS